MKIIEAAIYDMKKILKLQKKAFQIQAKIYNNYSIPPLIQTLKDIKKEFKEKYFLKAIVDQEIIGSVRGNTIKKTCYIGKLIVHPDHHNKGIGTKLMDSIEKKFSHVDRFELFSGYKSKKNIYLYKKRGYKIFKTEEHHNVKIVYMEKIIR